MNHHILRESGSNSLSLISVTISCISAKVWVMEGWERDLGGIDFFLEMEEEARLVAALAALVAALVGFFFVVAFFLVGAGSGLFILVGNLGRMTFPGLAMNDSLGVTVEV
jgi:hypothetical protein